MLTVPEIAKEFRVQPATVRGWLRRRQMDGVRLSDRAGWRVRRSEVARFLAAHKPAGPDADASERWADDGGR